MAPPPIPVTPKKPAGCFKIALVIIGIAVGLFIVLAVVAAFVAADSEPRKKSVDHVDSKASAAPAPEIVTNQRPPEMASPDLAAERERLITQITWKEISAIYALGSKATDIVKEEKWKAYKGREIRWTGTVSEVTKDFNGHYTLAVKMSPDTLTSDIFVKLRADQMDSAFKLSKGDKVTYEAKLKEWGSLLPITAEEGSIILK